MGWEGHAGRRIQRDGCPTAAQPVDKSGCSTEKNATQNGGNSKQHPVIDFGLFCMCSGVAPWLPADDGFRGAEGVVTARNP